MKLVSKAPKTNLIRRIKDLKKDYFKNPTDNETGQQCVFKTTGFDINQSFEDKFTIISKNAGIALMLFLVEIKKHVLIWFNSKKVYELNYYFYLRKNDKDKKYFFQMYVKRLK